MSGRPNRKEKKPWVGHFPGCECFICTEDRTTPVKCKFEGCERICKNDRGAKSHYRSHFPRLKKPKRTILPDGMGYVRGALTRRIDLSPLFKFATILDNTVAYKKVLGRFGKRHEYAIAEWKARPKSWFDTHVYMPGAVMALVGEIAQTAKINPKYVWTALVAYGIEHLAAELRHTPEKLPTARLPRTWGNGWADPAGQKPTNLFPSKD